MEHAKKEDTLGFNLSVDCIDVGSVSWRKWKEWPIWGQVLAKVEFSMLRKVSQRLSSKNFFNIKFRSHKHF